MKNLLPRIVSLLLMASLLADPSLAAALSQQQSFVANHSRENLVNPLFFTEQAVSVPVVWMLGDLLHFAAHIKSLTAERARHSRQMMPPSVTNSEKNTTASFTGDAVIRKKYGRESFSGLLSTTASICLVSWWLLGPITPALTASSEAAQEPLKLNVFLQFVLVPGCLFLIALLARIIPLINRQLSDKMRGLVVLLMEGGFLYFYVIAITPIAYTLRTHPFFLLGAGVALLALIIPAVHEFLFNRRYLLKLPEAYNWQIGFFRSLSIANVLPFTITFSILIGFSSDATIDSFHSALLLALFFAFISDISVIDWLKTFYGMFKSSGNVGKLIDASLPLLDLTPEEAKPKAIGVSLLLPFDIHTWIDEPYLLRFVGFFFPIAVIIYPLEGWRPLSQRISELGKRFIPAFAPTGSGSRRNALWMAS